MNGVRVWRGIRFAQLEHRFARPDVVDLAAAPEPGGKFGLAPWQPVHPGFDLGAERGDDSLSLNIWAPEEAEELPVLLWFYGGGFEAGAASMPAFDGAALAEHAHCVVVTANYRVGFIGFGHLAHRGGRLAGASNLGVHDALAAREWVRRHITTFGGDPKRLTIAGQSAGGFLGCAVATAPGHDAPQSLALFSGGASRLVSEGVAIELADALITRLGIDSDPELIIEMPPERILEVQSELVPRDLGIRNGPDPYALGIVVEASVADPVVPEHPMEVIASGALVDTRILSSATLDEAVGFAAADVGVQEGSDVESELRRFGDGADMPKLVSAYSRIDDPTARRQRILTDYIYRLPAARLAQAQIAAGGATTLLDIPRNGREPAPHGVEVNALFARREGTARDAEMLRLFSAVITGEDLPTTGPSDPAEPKGAYPPDVPDPQTLLDLWEGATRR